MSDVISAADYGGKVITGKSWLRAYRVLINNPYGGPAFVTLDEERITTVADTIKSEQTESLSTEVVLSAVIELYDPTTGLKTGQTMRHADVYVALYSVYRQLGEARDVAAAAAAAEAARLQAIANGV